MRLKQILIHLFLLMCIACREKGNDDLILISSLLLADSLWDRPEKYDRDVQIVTHTPIAEYSQTYTKSISYDIDYSDADVNYLKDLLQAQIARYPRGYWIKARAGNIVLCRNLKIYGSRYGGMAAPEINTIFFNVPDDLANLGPVNPTSDSN
ncbi:hypothetical protein LEP1GSC198_1194 [Leptospira kirschneri str. JB]|nr:hypothetical protein [Leptospira kirschneri]EMJ87411.1 hypothetical protein LEP1GSC198_1194 [Leptospira kirschneri str. JB]